MSIFIFLFFFSLYKKNWFFMFPFFCPFFPNIVTFSIGLKGACTYSMWSIVEHLLSRVCSGEWRYPKFGTLAIAHSPADERGVRAMSLRFSRSLVLPPRSCRYVTHQGGRAIKGCERWSLRVLSSLAPPLVSYVTRATLRVYCGMGSLGFCEEYYIF